KVRGANPPDAPVYDDLKGALTFLRSVSLADQRRLAVFGFCRGGVHALMAARAHEEIRVIVVFHGFAFRSSHSQPGAQPYDLAVRTHPGYDEHLAKQSFDEAKRFLETHLTRLD